MASQEEAKRAILEAFGNERDPVACYHQYPEAFYLEHIDLIRGMIPLRDATERDTVSRFLYAGCLRFDRWSQPSPFTVSSELNGNFERFLEALKASEGTANTNTAVFELHLLHSALYRLFDCVPLREVEREDVLAARRRVVSVPRPQHDARLSEFREYRRELLDLLEGLADGSLRTLLVTRIPYIVHKNNLVISAEYERIPVTVQIRPIYSPSRGPLVTAGPTAVVEGASRWQGGYSEVEIQAAAIIDAAREVPSLQELPGSDMQLRGWPQGLAFAFGVLHEIVWHLRLRHGGERQWLPAPRDLPEITTFLKTAAARGPIDWVVKSSPAAVFQLFSAPGDELRIDLGRLEPIPWSSKCRALAVMYLELGETNEALFWLNVGFEALFRERVASIAVELERSDLEREIESPRAFWAPAEEVLSEQFPAMAGKVNWPDTEVHVGIYARIKYLYKRVQMQTAAKQVLSHYGIVAAHRSALFHGATQQRLGIEEVTAALASYDWLVESMVAKR